MIYVHRSMADTFKFTEPKSENEEDAAFAKAIDVVLSTGKADYPSYVGGLKVASGMSANVFSPIDRTIIFGTYQEPDNGLVDRAVTVAEDAFAKWSKTKVDDRVAVFEKVIAKIEQQRFRLAAMVSVSVGMDKTSALEEVDALISIIKKACSDIKKKGGKAQGVWAVLSSYNSPLAAPIGYASVAIIAGNTVIMTPSVHSTLPVYYMYGVLTECGVPDGVLNVITDSTSKSSEDLANNVDVIGVVASGSVDKMEDLMFLQADDTLKFVNEIKGMNPILVYRPANMKTAARTVLDAAFRFNGQSINSCSKVILVEGQQEEFVKNILAEANSIKITDPTTPDAYAGPIISDMKAGVFDFVLDSIRGNVIFGGKRVKGDLTENGCYVMPAIVMGLDDEHDLNNMDSALPILSIQVASDLDDAIDIINCTEYGLSAGIITKDDAAAKRFKEQVDAESIFINDRKVPSAGSKAVIDNFVD